MPPSDNVSVRGSSNNSRAQTHLCWLRGRTYSRRSKGITVVQMHDINALWQFSPYSPPCGSIKMLLITFTCIFYWSKLTFVSGNES